MSGHLSVSEHGDPLSQAAAWRVRLTEMDVPSCLDFEQWLTDPANGEAWRQISRPWDYLSEQAHHPALVEARQAALGNARRANAQLRAAARLRRPFVGVAAVLLIAAVGWGAMAWLDRPDDFQTVQGERRVITLVDGSKISLDSNSEVTVRYTKNARELRLLRGQARFDVAHDVERPFSVQAGNQKVIATGTAFNIDLAGQKVLVTLIEGHVVVLDENARAGGLKVDRKWPNSIELHAGQQLAAVPAAPPAVESTNVEQVTAWTSGQIVFDNEALSSVVERVNRYANTQIVIADPKVADMRISGVLNAGDVNGFIDIVTHYLPVHAARTDDGDIALTDSR